MYLRSIEIQGFKSFAHRTLLQFNDGVTAIVGPNGSGKSNIADAVRWVLGEQKVRQLRGTAMQDVIFAGTALRKAQGFAFVSITIDNADGVLPVDYKEVTVSRRLFRSGESEYVINGQKVRLKDVQELFYDTGIGKEGYSIIGQGQIDAILNGRPEDRRGLFDEAAGIVKFKRRKMLAVRRLESEQANLRRITDILDELERRVKPLERQAETARIYLKLRDEQKILDLNLFIRETGHIVESLEKARANTQIVRAALEEANAENERLKDAGAGLAESLQKLEEELSAKREEHTKAEVLLQNLQGQIQVLETEIHAEEQNIQRYTEQTERLTSEKAEEQNNILQYLQSLDELARSLAAFREADTDEAGIDRAEIGDLKDRVSLFRQRLLAIGEIRSLYGACGQAAESVTDPESEESRQPADSDTDDSFQLPDWMKAIRNKRDDLAEIREKEEKTTAWLADATEEYNRLTAELNEQYRLRNKARQEYAAETARYDQLKNLAERYEGFGESVRALMRERSRIGGIHGVVADLIHTGKQYETAIETALGGRIQNVVTENQRSAKAGIEYLKRTKQGRATFLPLDALKYKNQNEYRQAAAEIGAIGIASELVEADPEYRDLVNYLLGNVLVTDHIDHALSIANKYRQSLRIVTLEGELLSPGGSMAGGAYKISSNLIGRSRELNEFEERLVKMSSHVEELREGIDRLENLIGKKGGEIDDLNAEMKRISEERNSLSYGIMSDMRLRYAEFRQKSDFLKENIDRICSSWEQRESAVQELFRQTDDSRGKIGTAESDIKERNADIRHIEEGKRKLEQEIADTEASREALSGSRSGYASRREELNTEILELQKDLLRLENQADKEQQKLDTQSEYIWNEYEMSLSDAKGFYDEGIGSAQRIRQRLGSLRGEIRELGPVNVQAIEEFREVSERYSFLKTQHSDLTASEASILEIIRELDDGMKKQFNSQFRLIQEQFQQVFAELFGGGQASLELVFEQDESGQEAGNDELDAGIAIHVQPPGKKLQNIMQLSGGEKALTAIALLFAIQNLKPSPFCLLDEIEAALDDSNVIRFARYLHKLTEHTQFIVITHRRGTMESADRLYGVTMQEKGITKLVSVDLVSDDLS
ncbi:MAG: chromosome segregation protein SMC [Lachnospiraceae bacterium]|nr:chromosome segregation protein SMC [Lachnospiraceae bacterium]